MVPWLMMFAVASLALPGYGEEEKRPDLYPPQYDLTKEIDFERYGDFLLGPTGVRGWMHVRRFMTTDARQILITKVEPGSPADGILQEGDVILGVEGKPFAADPRRLLGAAIDRAESVANEGRLALSRWRPEAGGPRHGTTAEVVVPLRVMGTYSATAPYNCEKSERIYREALAVLAKDPGMGHLKALAFLATGEPEYIQRVRDYLHAQSWASPKFTIDVDGGGKETWSCGFHLLIMCEYQLLTGDDYVLPAIRETAIKASMGQSASGTWGHGFALPRNNGGKLHGDLVGYGALNLPALHTLNGLLLARKCGVQHQEVDQAIDKALTFFRQFSGHGSVSYGQHRPSFEHEAAGRNALGANGKNALAALAFAQAGDQDAAHFFSKLVASSYDNYEYGHGGNSFSVFWRALGANVGGPANAAAFQQQLRWYNTLTRRYDGSFGFQPLGGYYGSETINATAAHVLANSLPRKTLVLTGRNANPRNLLNQEEVASATAAGRWRNADYAGIPLPELIEGLGSFSPSAREWVAKGLAKRTDVDVAQLAAMLADPAPNRRAGAAAALGYQGPQAKETVPALLQALDDPDAAVRVAAGYALARIGDPASVILPGMLQALLRVSETEPIQPTTQALAYAIGYQQSHIAPLYFDGILAGAAESGDPLAGIDRDLLYAVVRKLASNSNGRVRSTGVAAIAYYNRTDIARNAQLLVDLIDESPRGHVMFRDSARAIAISALARHKIVDGVDYAIDRLDWAYWGGVMRLPHRFETLESYGGIARTRLGEIRQVRWLVPSGENRVSLEKAITAIQSAPDGILAPTLLDLVRDQLHTDLAGFDSKSGYLAACRKLQKEYADDGYWQAAILEALAARNAATTDDFIAALQHRSRVARDMAVTLAPAHLGWLGKRQLRSRLAVAPAAEKPALLELFAQLGEFDLVRQYLADEDDAVRAAAIGGTAGKLSLGTCLAAYQAAPGPKSAQAALRAIETLPALDVAELCQWFLAADEKTRAQVAGMLGRLGGQAAIEALLAAATTGPETVRKAALQALAISPDALAFAALLQQTANADPGNRQRSQFAQALLQRVAGGLVSVDQRDEGLQAVAKMADSTTARRAIDEIQWLPPAAAVRHLTPYLQMTDKKMGDVPIRAAAAIRAVSERCDFNKYPQVRAAVDALPATAAQ